MAIHGYVTHARRNRRLTGLLVLGYVLAFELIGAFALAWPLLIWDQEHTILSNPLGYALRYALPLGLVSGFVFWRLYRGHAAAVTRSLGIRIVARSDEGRFVAIAEEVCTTLGIRRPRFGVIEVDALNAITVGEGPDSGLIAVTRGLLDSLDDDELAAVLAHEAAHVRHGDTQLLAANHALMRTAVMLQIHNMLRLEDWRQLVIPLLFPPMLPLLLAGGATTMLALQLARFARRGLKLGRDHMADGEAVRVTHYPEALLSALGKIGGRSAFPGSQRIEGNLFDGPADREGGTHPAIADRLKAIATLGRELMAPHRVRRDTRTQAAPRFGYMRPTGGMLFPADASGRPLEKPPTGSLKMLALRFTDPDAFRRWQEACLAWYEWRAADNRNAFGLTPKLVIPMAAVAAFLLVFWWPADGDLAKVAQRFGPGRLVEMARQVNSGPDCFGPSYKDGLCPGYAYTPEQLAAKRGTIVTLRMADRGFASGAQMQSHARFMSLFMMVLVCAAIFRPRLLRKLFGVVDAKPDLFRREPLQTPRVDTQPSADRVTASQPMPTRAAAAPRSFGRKVS